MGRPRKNSSAKEQKNKFQSNLLRKQFWKKIPASEWLRILQQVNRGGLWSLNGRVLKGRCPYHDDNNPSMMLYFDKCFGKCFGCGKTITDLVALYAKLTNQNYSYALVELGGKLDLPELVGSGVNDLAEFNNLQEMKKSAAVAMHRVIEEFVRDRPEHLVYLLPGLRYLVQGRKLDLGCLRDLPVGLFAKPEHLKKYIPENQHQLFDKYFARVDPRWYGSVCFHYNSNPGIISRFKIRKLAHDAGSICEQFRSGNEMPAETLRALCEKEFYVVEDEYCDEMGVLGLHFYNRLIGASIADAYVTEGEFDALSVMCAQAKSGQFDFVIFAAGGTGNAGLSFLREYGIRTVWLVQDAPAKKGDEVVKRLLLNPGNFDGDSVNRALTYHIFDWPMGMRGGDLDEAMTQMGYESILHFLAHEKNANFLNTFSWVKKQCDREIAEIKLKYENDVRGLDSSKASQNKRDNYEATCREQIISVVRDWYRCLHSSTDRIPFIEGYSTSEGLNLSRMEEVKCSLYELDTLEGAVALLTRELSKYIEIVYYTQTANGPQYTVWSKKTRERFIMPMTDKAVEHIFTKCLKEDVIGWVRNMLSGSKLLDFKSQENELLDYDVESKRIMRILMRLVKNMIIPASEFDALVKVGQGVHWRDIGKQTIYFVNGDHVFKGWRENGSSCPMEWERLENTCDDGLYFMLDRGKTWSDVLDVSDLYSSAQIDPRHLFNDVRRILDGWKFEEHELMRDYIACWIMSLPIQRAIGQVNLTFITGASMSGKTSFVRGLLGGNLEKTSFEVPTIIEGSCTAADATAAGIYQEMDASALTLCLDEAEARQDTAHSERVSTFQELAYSIPFGGATISRGGSTAGSRVKYTMQMPVVMAAINMTANPVFLSRVVPIYTQKDPTRENIGTYLSDRFTAEDIRRIRTSITTCFLGRLPELYERMASLRAECAKIDAPVKITDRYISILLPALLIYDYMGFDAVDLFRRLVIKNQQMLENLDSIDFQSDIINTVLYVEGIKTTMENGASTVNVSVRDLVLNRDIVTLNSSGSGVFLLQERGWIIIFWRSVKQRLLRFSKYRYLDEASLRESVAKNSLVIHNITEADHKYIIDVLGLTDVKNLAQYTVLSAEYLLTKEILDEVKKNPDNSLDIRRNQEVEIPVEAYENDLPDSSVNGDFVI